ncbi:MAG: hypothetical protein JXD23_13365 [Spirochaetales bacterium]|nr:hypothetical protein [Spirochaetales bacterium]
MKRIIFCLAVVCLAAPALVAANESAALERYGIIVGSNEGGPERVSLRFAASDAQAFAAVMQDMGGLPVSNRVLLLNPMLDNVVRAFADMGKKIAAAKSEAKRREFVFYYSGHSDEEGLLIGEQRLGYKELRTLITGVNTDVRMAVIDSCASGVFIRAKGGVQRPPFMQDAAVEMKGYAFLTSSSETEAAQESDNIEASFFTHYLVSGLRGAADASRDGVVTLNEAYQYAFNETLVRTERTQFGPQHPSYDIQLTGTGDLVLTDLRETSAGLLIDDAVTGRIYIRDAAKKLVVELNKQDKGSLEIGLSPGDYTVLVDAQGALSQAAVRLSSGRRAILRASDLRAVQPEGTVRRGDEPDADAAPDSAGETEPADDFVFQFNVLRLTLFPTRVARPNSNVVVTNNVLINLTVGRAQTVAGAAVSVFGCIIENDLYGFAGSSLFTVVNGDMAGAAASGLFNIVNGRAGYVQTAGLFNVSGGDFAGAQLSGLFNVSGGTVSGVQAAGLFNSAGNVNGLQTSGLFNGAGDVNGAQIGVINTAKNVRGVQIGLVNISENNDGFALGLFNIEKNGIHDIEAWQDMSGFTNVAFKLGTKISYGMILGGCDFANGSQSWYVGAGFGFRIPIGPFFIDLDAAMLARYRATQDVLATPFESTLVPQARLKAGFRLGGAFSIFAGVGAQVYIPGLLYDSEFMADSLFSIPIDGSAQPVNIVPRAFFGIQLF